MSTPAGAWRRVALLLLVTAGLWMLAGCGDSSAPREAEAGILRVGNGPEPRSLDAHQTTGISALQIQQALWEGLVRAERTTLQPQPGVAESWETEADGTIYRFRLRESARWSDGEPVTAEDFVAALRRALHPEGNTPYAEMLYVLEGAQAYHGGEVPAEELGAVARGVRELEVHLAEPVPYFLSLLLHPVWYPVPAHRMEAGDHAGGRRAGSWTTAEGFVGNGPFRLERHLPNQLVEVRASGEYWDAESIGLRGVRFFPFSEPAAEERAFLAGQLDVTDSLPSGRASFYRERHPEWLQVDPYLGTYYILLNTRVEPLGDARVRRALALAIDRERLVTALLDGGQQAAGGFVPDGMPDYEAEIERETDPAAARALLAEAGFGGGSGFPQLEYLFNSSESHKRIAEALQEMWRVELGVDLRLTNLEWKTYLQRRESGDYELARAVWIGDYVEPSTFLNLWRGDGDGNWAGWQSERYDELLRKARRTGERAERYALYAEAERILISEQVVIPLYHYVSVYLKQPRVQSWAGNLLDWPVWREVQVVEENP